MMYKCTTLEPTFSWKRIRRIKFTTSYYVSAGLPEIIIYPNDTNALEGNNASIICSATSEPAHMVNWLKDGVRLNSFSGKFLLASRVGDDSREVVSTLTIVNLVMSDKGNYTCSVSNSFGRDSASAHLEVQGVWVSVCAKNSLEIWTIQFHCHIWCNYMEF